MVSYNPDLLDKHVAPGISVFTGFEAPDLTNEHPEAPHWLANHFLNTVFRGTFKNKFRQYAVNQLYRAQVAFADYQEARMLTADYLDGGHPHNPRIRAYFRAVARWESCLLNLQIFIDVMNKMGKELNATPVFAENDGTAEQRAYSIANCVKHFGADIAAGRHNEADTIPVWLTNHGLKTRGHELSYAELATLVGEVATAAGELQDPLTFAKPDA
jgi:hypothetical protein